MAKERSLTPFQPFSLTPDQLKAAFREGAAIVRAEERLGRTVQTRADSEEYLRLIAEERSKLEKLALEQEAKATNAAAVSIPRLPAEPAR